MSSVQAQKESGLDDFKRLYLAKDLMHSNPTFLQPCSTIQQVMEILHKHSVSSLLVVNESVLDGSFQLCGRIYIKEVFRQLFPGLKRKDLIVLNQVLHEAVEKVMSISLRTLSSSSNIKETVSMMLEDYPQVAGVRQDGKLIGYISNTSLLKLFKPVEKKGEWLGSVSSTTPKVFERIAKHVLCLSPKDEISKAMEVFMATDSCYIAILDGQGKLLRILAQEDVLEYILELIESKELTEFEKKGLILDRKIGSLIEKEVATISQTATMINAAKKMAEKNVTCLAVTDAQQRFYGFLSLAEVLAWLQEHLK